MKLPPIRMVPVPEAQRLNTANWLAEWELEGRLEIVDEATGLNPVPAEVSKTVTARPWRAAANPMEDPFPAPGHVRLLTHEQVPDAGILQYVAVLSRWEGGLLVIAPFSGYQHPATRGELLTGRPEPQLAVLSPWCAFSVHPFLLAQSWYIDKLSPALLKSAWKIFRHAATGAPIPVELEAQVGAPIVNPLDPRIRHQRWLSRRMATLISRTAALERLPATPEAHLAPTFGTGVQKLALAAASAKVAPAFEEVFSVLKKGVVLQVSLETDGRHCDFEVFDLHGTLSSALDGAIVVTAETGSKPFKGGRTRLELDAIKTGFRICRPDGCHIRLRKKN